MKYSTAAGSETATTTYSKSVRPSTSSWSALIECLVVESGFATMSLKSKWDSVELYNRYRHAYEVIIVAVLSYVTEVVPPAHLHHPEVLIQFADVECKGTRVSVLPDDRMLDVVITV